jgi:predicted ATPase
MRLITLTSIGCVGKTRRATRIAARNYANGARVVTLAQPPDGADVIAAMLELASAPKTRRLHLVYSEARLVAVVPLCCRFTR